MENVLWLDMIKQDMDLYIPVHIKLDSEYYGKLCGIYKKIYAYMRKYEAPIQLIKATRKYASIIISVLDNYYKGDITKS